MKRFLLASLMLLQAPTAHAAVETGYKPQDKDERGLWMVMDEEERKLKTSSFLIRDEGLNAYVRQVFCRTVGDAACKDVRIYLVRTPYFNASMAPNGMMVVYSGLFLRTRDEAQFAAVLGHEFTHYKNQHSLRLFRDVKKKSNAMAWLSIIPVGGYAVAGALTAVQLGMIGSIYGFSREMESEADAGSIPLMAQAGYDPKSASQVWEEIRAEEDATAAARGTKSRKDKNGGMFGTHPPTAERMATLAALATKQALPGKPDNRRAQYRAALAPYWTSFIDDQIKLNDFGATEFLLADLAKEGWTPELLYARGELYRTRGRPEDLTAAAGFYKQAIAGQGAPAEAWRGLGLAQMRSGAKSEGQASLRRYLEVRPNAPDRAMIASIAGASQ